MYEHDLLEGGDPKYEHLLYLTLNWSDEFNYIACDDLYVLRNTIRLLNSIV